MPGTAEFVANYFMEKKAKGDTILSVTQKIPLENIDNQKEKFPEIIDVLVLAKEEVYIVKTQDTFQLHGSLRDSKEPLKRFFNRAEDYIKKNYELDGKQIKRLFVTDELSFIFF